MTAVEVEFDPASTTVEFVAKLATKAQCSAVLTHLGIAPMPPKTKLEDCRKIAASVLATKRQAEHDAQQPVVEATPVEEPSAELVARPVEIIPSASKFHDLVAMGQVLAKSSLVPVALRGKPEDVTVILLAANDLGIPVTQALDKIHVIDGRKGMAAELMVALVLRDGHAIWPDPANDTSKATVHVRRADTGVEAAVSFTIDEAVDAGLVSLRDGKPYSRSRNGKAQPWELYPADLLWARCVSRAMRRLCPDSLAGVSYTPEELGAIEQDDPGPSGGRHGEATVTLNQRREQISERCRLLSAAGKAALLDEWRTKNLPRRKVDGQVKVDFGSLSAGAMAALTRWLDGLGPEAWAAGDEDAPQPGAEAAPEPGDVEAERRSPDPAEGRTGALTEDPDEEAVEGEIVDECADPLCFEPADSRSKLGFCEMHREF